MKFQFESGPNLTRLLERLFDRDSKQLSKIQRSLDKIMASQQEFDDKITAAQEAIDAIGVKVTEEAAQIAQFIADNPAVNTSALDGVVARLQGVSESVSGIFTPPAEPEA